MMDTSSPRRSRSRRTQREQHLYTARAAEYTSGMTEFVPDEPAYTPNEETTPLEGYTPNEETTPLEGYTPNGETLPLEGYTPNEEAAPSERYTPNEEAGTFGNYTPNEESSSFGKYTPNEPEDVYAGYTPNEETEPVLWHKESAQQPPQVDYSAYYSREASETNAETQPAFAPPPSMAQYANQPQEPEEPAEYSVEYPNIYRVRTASWADEERQEAIAERENGYQVREDAPVLRKKRRALPVVLIVLAVTALLAAAGWLLRDVIAAKLGLEVFSPEITQEPFAAVVTPEPIRAYDAAPAAAVAETTRNTIASLSGTVSMENHIVTDRHVVTRSRRADGSYDFYLFTAEGRLLCYFEGLGPQDMIPQENNTFYVAQAPWLIAPGGSALIRTSDIEAALNESVFLHPMYHGWAVVESEADGHANYVSADGQVLSSLWFSRLFPFTGEYTLAYVDTGSAAGGNERYLLYIIGEDGSMIRWLSASHTEDVVSAVCGMAYMSDGSLYRLPDVSTPAVTSPEIIAYPDCDALVVRSPENGKYGLFVRGEQHYDFVYDAIHPLESDIVWAEKKLGGENAAMTIKAVSGASFPQPLSHSFVLEKEGAGEYVSLSTGTSYPIRLDGEF